MESGLHCIPKAQEIHEANTMSATNRGGKREVSDYYRTPQWAILQMLEALTSDSVLELGEDLTERPLDIVDPCAGGDETHGMAYPDAIGVSGMLTRPRITTVDIRTDSRAVFSGQDYLTWNCEPENPDIIMTNPPFCDALAIINKALIDVKDGGLVIMLQRLNFFGSEERSEWFQTHMPVLTYVHAKRMQFSDAGGSDSIEYAHFVWRKNFYPRFTKLRVLPAP